VSNLMIVAGEPSGDAHAASLVTALQNVAPQRQFNFFGATGPLMREAGVETVVNSDELAILGIVEVTRVFPKFLRAFRELKSAALERKPAAIILVDWPEFNLRLAKSLHRRGLRIIYYISPQVWAWRSYRVNQISRDVDLLLSILPFEVDWFAKHGMNQVEYVGHPLAGKVRARYDRAEFCRLHDLDPAGPIVALLPGSRGKELARILPPMLDAASLLAADNSAMQFVAVVAPSRSRAEVEQIISQSESTQKVKPALTVVENETREALAAADAAAITSGTATLEAALLGTPMVIVYKESAINWHTLGSLIHGEHIGLPNIIAGRGMFTELMQNDLNGPGLAREILALLNPERNQLLRAQLLEVRNKLGESDASRRAAERVLSFLGAN
jgi:lipid-A-disaccharide synthase